MANDYAAAVAFVAGWNEAAAGVCPELRDRLRDCELTIRRHLAGKGGDVADMPKIGDVYEQNSTGLKFRVDRTQETKSGKGDYRMVEIVEASGKIAGNYWLYEKDFLAEYTPVKAAATEPKGDTPKIGDVYRASSPDKWEVVRLSVDVVGGKILGAEIVLLPERSVSAKVGLATLMSGFVKVDKPADVASVSATEPFPVEDDDEDDTGDEAECPACESPSGSACDGGGCGDTGPTSGDTAGGELEAAEKFLLRAATAWSLISLVTAVGKLEESFSKQLLSSYVNNEIERLVRASDEVA